MGKRNVYLSLDDLHKLYGISNTVINAIKKKRKKRRNKKLKINNSSMGAKPAPSDHMVGSSSALEPSSSLAVATQQLNNAKITKHIEDINRNNLLIENKKEDNNKNADIPLEVKIYNKLKNKELLTPDELQAYEEIQNVMMPKPVAKPKRAYRRKAFDVPADTTKLNALASESQSSVMGRDYSYNNVKVSEDDGAGSNVHGTSSDQFINNDAEEFVSSIPPPEDAPVAQSNDGLQADSNYDPSGADPPVMPENPNKGDELVYAYQLKMWRRAQNLDENTGDPINNQQNADEYKSVDTFTIKELKAMAKDNIAIRKNINKQDLYDLLLDSNLIPMK